MTNRRLGKPRPMTFSEMDENLQILRRHGREWSSGYTYNSGETVYYDSSIYIAQSGTTTQGTFVSNEWTEFITSSGGGTTAYKSTYYDNSSSPTAPQSGDTFTIGFTGDTRYLEWDLSPYMVSGDYDVTIGYSGRTFDTRQVGYMVLDLTKHSGDTINITVPKSSGDTIAFIPSSYATYNSSTNVLSISGLVTRYVINVRMINISSSSFFYEYSVTELQI